MGYANLNRCLADLEAQGQLRRVDVELDPCLELAAVQRRAFRAKAPALLFTRVKDTRFPMLANLFGTRERLRCRRTEMRSPPCRNTPATTRRALPRPRATCGVRSASLRVFQSKYTLQ